MTVSELYEYLELNGFSISTAIDLGYLIKNNSLSLETYHKSVDLYCDLHNIKQSEIEIFKLETIQRL